MKRTYAITLELTVDDEHRESIVRAVRDRAAVSIRSIDDALIELVRGHAVIDMDGLEFNSITCDSTVTAAEAVSPAGGEDDLDSYEGDVYLCRWPNGDFSIVSA